MCIKLTGVSQDVVSNDRMCMQLKLQSNRSFYQHVAAETNYSQLRRHAHAAKAKVEVQSLLFPQVRMLPKRTVAG